MLPFHRVFLLLSAIVASVKAFVSHEPTGIGEWRIKGTRYKFAGSSSGLQLDEHQENLDESSDDEEYAITEPVYDGNVLPPALNLRKESILFSEQPATRSNNNTLRFWRLLKTRLPFALTGARTPETADDNPIGGIYNMLFVRLPTIGSGIVYGKNLIEGHGLVVDFGDGPTEVSPLLVFGVLYAILR